MKSASQARVIASWLLLCCFLVFCMVVLGGVTRLTQSGLSMVDWDPIMGSVPPLTDEEWGRTFERYKQFPEYQKVNKGMSLSGFKQIFYVEYAHRMLGRLIGLVFFFPLLFFIVTRRIPSGLAPKLFLMFFLGGLQGLLGWYMVKSGLVEDPHVSPYRLTAHLLLAVAIYLYMFWVALDLLDKRRVPATAGMRRAVSLTVALLLIMIASGGFVAGTKAGFAFNTFPLMHDRWLPQGMWVLDSWWRNIFETIPTVQFIHRHIAYTLVIVIVLLWLWLLRSSPAAQLRGRGTVLLLALALQVGLGITTLLHSVPVSLAAAHQAGALLLVSAAIWLRHGFRPRAAMFA